MKKILFNGCSFVAGDEIGWKSYCDEAGISYTWFDFCKIIDRTDEQEKLWHYYHDIYKRKCNLPHFVIDLLGLSENNKVDISADGKSNDNISISTIQYFLSIPPENRKNYHVVVGWTQLSRIMVYTPEYLNYMDLNINHIHKPVKGTKRYIDYIKAVLLNAENEDLALNYFKNVMLLEYFLLSNNITYTFFRSLGSEKDCIMRKHFFPPVPGSLEFDKISNANSWVKLSIDSKTPITESSWTEAILGTPETNPENFMLNNGHPSPYAVTNFAAILANKILQQQCLF